MTTREITLPLPPDFRREDLLAFHRRDTQEVAERVTAQGIHKGLLWQGRPALLSLSLEDGMEPPQARVQLQVDDGPVPDPAHLTAWATHLLGLDQPIAAFAAAHRHHPQLGPLLQRLPGLRVPQTATPFEAITWAITGQQISVAAAVSLRRKLIQAAGLHHSSGLACYPDAEAVARLGEEALGQAGFSRSKAATLDALARDIATGKLVLDLAPAQRTELLPQLENALLARRGIGPWTVHYTLLRGYGWLDGSLHGDVAVRRGLGLLLGREMTARDTERWLAPFHPWRALVAAHLWASLKMTA